jgi:hypothetical protein
MNTPAIYSSKFSSYHVELNRPLDVILRTTSLGLAFINKENAMRRITLATAATLAVLAASALITGRAEAMSISAPAGLQVALDETKLAQDVAYVCRRAWRCGPYGCGWRRACWWTGGGGPYYGYGYAAPYRRYGYGYRHGYRW